MYGHIFKLSKQVVKGIEQAGGEAILKQVEELLPEKYINNEVKKVKEKIKEVPIADPQEGLKGIDGLIIGTPTRYGNMTAQMRQFWDQTGPLWQEGALIGKPASVFTSTATQHGGQETTIITTMITLLHHGMIILGLPYSNKELFTLDEPMGGSPYGPSTIAGNGRGTDPKEKELRMCRSMGKRIVEIGRKLSK